VADTMCLKNTMICITQLHVENVIFIVFGEDVEELE